jgi:hypothetical protein
MVRLLCLVYFLVAVGGLALAILGRTTAPAPLPLIDGAGNRTEQLEQARRMMEQAQQHRPDQAILAMFYRGGIIGRAYRSLERYEQPLFEGDSFERRVASCNCSARAVDEIYQDAVAALALLSSGSFVLTMVMLWAPSYLVALLLGVHPVAVVIVCALTGINSDPLEICWAPFQLAFSFRFGRQRQRTNESPRTLMVYRRGLLMVNLGLLLLFVALLMTTRALPGSGNSLRTGLWMALLGEEGVAILSVVVGIILVLPGVYFMCRGPRGEGS